jgi:hypothetical protein
MRINIQGAPKMQSVNRGLIWPSNVFLGHFYGYTLKGYLVNCLEHFFLYFFCLQIKFPQLFAMFQSLFLLLSCINTVFVTSMRGRPRAFFFDRSLQQNVFFWNRKFDMSDMSYKQELGEVGEGGEVDEGHLQHYLAPRLTRECASLSIATP